MQNRTVAAARVWRELRRAWGDGRPFRHARILARMLHGRDLTGATVSGATEGNITALWMARNATRRRTVIAAKSAHFSVRKAADLLGLRLVEVGLDDEYRMDVDALRRKMTKD